MKLKIVVHEADEGGFWPEVPSIPGCATQGETIEELLTISMKRSRAVCRSKSNLHKVSSATASWRSRYEGDFGKRLLSDSRTQWLVSAPRQWKPPHLRQIGRDGPAVGSGSRQRFAQKWFAFAFDEVGRTHRIRPINPKQRPESSIRGAVSSGFQTANFGSATFGNSSKGIL